MKFLLRFSLDTLGFYTSALCAIHCFAVPLLLVYTSIHGVEWLHAPVAEYAFIGVSLILAVSSFYTTYRKGHQNQRAFKLLLLGFALIFFGRLELSFWIELICMTAGALTIATAHYQNWRLCRSSHYEVNG